MTGPSITEFINARLDEREAKARAAFRSGLRYEGGRVIDDVPDDGRWSTPDSSHYEERIEGIGITIYDEGGHNAEQARFIAANDPAYVLADIAAKRAILRECRFERERRPLSPRAAKQADYILMQLAQPFSSHEQWNPDWSMSE